MTKTPSIEENLLRIFFDNKDHPLSGEDLAHRLNVSRTAVWNHMESLRKAGFEIEARPHVGYRLTATPDRLLPDEIKARLKTNHFGKVIHSYEEVDSTNDLALRLAEEGAPEGTVVIAESQRKGRGRLGRPWHSSRNKGLWFSLILRPKLIPSKVSLITLTAALAVVRVVSAYIKKAPKIKWPNDVHFEGKKLCGILSEMSSSPGQIRHVIIGVGINLNQEEGDFPEELRSGATSVRLESEKVVSRVPFLSVLLAEWEKLYLELADRSDEIVREIKSVCDTLNQLIQVKQGEQTISGTAIDFDLDGALLLRRPDGNIEKILSGDLLHVTGH